MTRQPVRTSVLWSIGALLTLWLGVIVGSLLRSPGLGLVVGALAASFFVAGWFRASRRERRAARQRRG